MLQGVVMSPGHKLLPTFPEIRDDLLDLTVRQDPARQQLREPAHQNTDSVCSAANYRQTLATFRHPGLVRLNRSGNYSNLSKNL
jgi:hypothetical protein